ncbi:MAG: T9SS type A sorting domain-containing protein [Bacteroidota bacterium]
MPQMIRSHLLILLLTLLATSIMHAQITRQQCYLCHANPGLSKTITLSTGSTETIPLYVDTLKFNASLHSALLCVQCHTDITPANLYNHSGSNSLPKSYGGWARFSAKNDTVTPGGERTRNYYTAASMSCNKSGCHPQQAAFDSSTHHVTWRQKQAHVHTVNGESVGEAYVFNDCNRCHTSCATCHFKSNKVQKIGGDVLAIWDSLQFFGDGGSLSRSGGFTEYAMDWTVNVESHTFYTGDSLRATNAVCQSCHLGYYKPPMYGFLSEDPPYPKAWGSNIRRHPQTQELTLSQQHSSRKCAQCHTNVHAYPGRQHNWQEEGDVKCQTCHTMTNHYPQHTTVDCISCHFTGFGRSKGQNAHDVWRWPVASNRVRPLVMKYNEAINWYPHTIVRPDTNTSCAGKCHYEGNLIGASTITSVPISKEVPGSFALEQNYPNPFNPNTTIRFAIPTKELVRIAVYDVLGRFVTTLVNETTEPGTYKILWNGIDHAGMQVSSGVYFYRIEAGTFSSSRKMLLVR